jgi:hypothetical protein
MFPFVLAGDIRARQHCAPTTMIAGGDCTYQQSIIHVPTQTVFGLVIQHMMSSRQFLLFHQVITWLYPSKIIQFMKQ